LLSFRTCLDVIPTFSYKSFVEPMLAKIRRTYNERFYVAGEGQILASTARPKPQESVKGNVVAGSLIGAGVGAGAGMLIAHAAGGGALATILAGVGGLLVGGFIGGFVGGLTGKRLDQ
jgi:hypothetical protein